MLLPVTMSRLTRNTAVSSLNLVNKEMVGKGSNIPVMAKRKTGSTENVPAKRAALGDLTNARGNEPSGKGGKNAGLEKVLSSFHTCWFSSYRSPFLATDTINLLK